MDDFQAATDRFMTWFKSVGGEFRDDLIEIKDLRIRDAGREIIATKDIPEDTTLFAIPRSAIISTETSDLADNLPRVFSIPQDDDENEWEPLDPWASLILVIIYEYLQGKASRWRPYLDILPQTFDTPIFWTDTELKEPEGTCLSTEKIGRQESDDMLRSQVLPIIVENSSIFYLEGAVELGEDELLSLAHRIASAIMAYAFDLDNGEEDSDDEEDGWAEDREVQTMLGMVPMADILNANADFNAPVNHGDSLEVTALRSRLSAGTEILNYYGPLPSSELLRRYGYGTPEHRRYDVVELPWALDVEIDSEDFEEYFIIERDSGEPDGQGRLTYDAKLRELPPEIDEQLTKYLKAINKLKSDVVTDKRKRMEACKAAIAQALVSKLEQYPTSVKEDEALLKRGNLARRHQMAIQVRLGEKILLQEAITLIQGSVTPGQGPSVERASKRARTTTQGRHVM